LPNLNDFPNRAIDLNFDVAYLNNPIVQAALHIIPLPTSEAVPWNVCSDPLFKAWNIYDVYADTTGLFRSIYSTVSKQRQNGERTEDFKMLIFSGDSDGICATVGTQHWIYSVTSPAANASSSSATAAESYYNDLSSITSLWKPWMIDDGETHVNALTGETVGGQQGGFLTKFEGSFSFATVHSAGHEVPAYQPAAALTLFAGFLNGSVFSASVDASSTANGIGYSAAVAITIVIIALLGLVAVCVLMYQRERKFRRGSAGPPVSMIESAEEDEGREGPGTLTTRVTTHRQYTAVSSGKYIAMATDEAQI
jgi:Serine carboxypeptidase